MGNPVSPFHLAFPTADLAKTRAFMETCLGAGIGRTSERWVDFDFYGHQITAHLVDEAVSAATNPVDGKTVPAFHFGVILEWSDWEQLAARLEELEIQFEIGPYVRFKGETGEQGTFFVREPGSNTAMEFKTFRDFAQIFAS